MSVRRRGFVLQSGLFFRLLQATLILLIGLTAGASAEAQAPAIKIELNGAEANAKACRLSFVITNDQPATIDDMALELVLFDKTGRVDRFVVVRTAKIPAGKNRVRQFDIPETGCGDIGRVLLNDIKDCKGDGFTPAVCADRISASTRADIGFDN
ncbi:hypothetical protein OSH11_22890 [Kaistia dalseonensis]|uniref:Tat pathway signal sequence domain protein n=1 Tax=Kaistia dalseonensis TaxID=410840 RepID=A0ABU0HEC5_9HYPH|nr:hypothetical protein [Kaistia dalseonensis]MCX5497563.1 hypothetical protein [Kaistia dalseonensis]MDQ0440203.1 hypothetical protein [Kaistia dalseonensis]